MQLTKKELIRHLFTKTIRVTLFFITFSILIPSISAQTNYLYTWHWAGLSEKDMCNDRINLITYSSDFRKKIEKNGHRIIYKNTINSFLELYENNIKENSKSIIPFITCENDIISVRIYVYDHSLQQLTFELSKKIKSNQFSFEEVNELALNVSIHIEDIGNIQSTIFEEILYRFRIDYLYTFYLESDSISIGPPYTSKRLPTSEDLINALNHYTKHRNAEYLDSLRKEREKKPHLKTSVGLRMDKLKKKYPHLIQLCEAIAIFEDYKQYPLNRDNMGKMLIGRLKSLQISDDEFTKKERKKYLSEINHDEYAKDIRRGATILLKCSEIFSDAENFHKTGNTEKAIAIFFEILKNQNISDWIKQTDVKFGECNELKEISYNKSDSLYLIKRENYLNLLTKADNLYKQQRCSEAIPIYLKLDSLNKNISMYPSHIIQSCQGRLSISNKQKAIIAQREITTQNIFSIFAQKFGMPPPGTDFLDKKFTVDVVNDTIVWTMKADEEKLKGWWSEIKYRINSYHSKYNDLIEGRLVEVINDIYTNHSEYVNNIIIEYTGSADATRFKKRGALNIIDPEYRNLDVKVCECQKSLDNNCYSFNKLKSGKGIKKDSDYSKNLALAYLRALHKSNTLNNLLDRSIPKNFIKQSICANVSEREGAEYRYVNISISVVLKPKPL